MMTNVIFWITLLLSIDGILVYVIWRLHMKILILRDANEYLFSDMDKYCKHLQSITDAQDVSIDEKCKAMEESMATHRKAVDHAIKMHYENFPEITA